MSKRHIQISKPEAKAKIEGQIQKGQALGQEGINILKGPSASHTRLRDSFEVKYQHWENFTVEILNEIFVSGAYSRDFKEQRSSEVGYVGSGWVPDIDYYLRKELLPKIDFLEILSGNLEEFDEVAKDNWNNNESKLSPPPIQARENSDYDFEKLTLQELLKKLTVPQLWKLRGVAVAIIVGAFLFGYNVNSWKVDLDKKELDKKNESLREENVLLRHKLDSLSQPLPDSVIMRVQRFADSLKSSK